MTGDIDRRLDRLESAVDRQRETIAEQRATIERQRERIAALERQVESDGGDDGVCSDADGSEREDDSDASNGSVDGPDGADTGVMTLPSRRALTAGGALGLAGLGTGYSAARVSSDGSGHQTVAPQGQVGTTDQPLRALYTEAVAGPLTGGNSVNDLRGDGLLVADDALAVDTADGLMMDDGSLTVDASDGLSTNGGRLTVATGTGLELSSGSVALDLASVAGENLTYDASTGTLDATSLGSDSAASMYLSGDQPTTGETTIQFDGTSFDPGGNVDTGRGTYTVPASGVYDVTVKAYTEAHTVSLFVNNAEHTTAEPPILTRTVTLSAGDTVGASVDGGGTVYGGETETYLTVNRVS